MWKEKKILCILPEAAGKASALNWNQQSAPIFNWWSRLR